MAKKGTIFNTYSNKIKLSAVQSYLNGEGSYDMITEKYQIRSSTQLKNWVKKYKECGEITDTRGENNKMKGIPNPLRDTATTPSFWSHSQMFKSRMPRKTGINTDESWYIFQHTKGADSIIFSD